MVAAARISRNLGAGLLLASLAGCASSTTSGVFKDYTTSFATARAAASAGSADGIEAVYGSDAGKANGAALLANFELGAFYQALGDFASSRMRLDRADVIAREIENRALISGRAVGRTAGSALTNDRALEFTGDSYERVMARSLNALNYLMLGDLDGARIEIRKAAEYQDRERARHDEELRSLQQESEEERSERQRGDEQIASSSTMSDALRKMDEYSREFENSFQNPFTYFLSGVVYELAGEKDDALLDYRRAYELWPESLAAARSLAALAAGSGRAEALATLTRPIPANITETAQLASASEEGRVVVVYLAGLIPQKQEVKFPIPVPGGGLAWVAFATYTDYSSPTDWVRVSATGEPGAITEPIVNLRALAVKALKERWKSTAARQVARAVAKTVARKAAKDEAERQGGPLAGLVAGLLGDIYNAASERADLRAWYSLPDEIQAATISLPVGTWEIRLERAGGAAASVPVSVERGKTALIVARGMDGSFRAWAPPRPGVQIAGGGR